MTKPYQIGDIVLHNWTIEKLIGEGSFGKVYQIGRDDFGIHYSAALKIMTVPQSEAERRSILDEGLSNQNVTEYFYTMVQEIVKEFALMAQFKGTANIVSYEDHQVVEHDNREGWDILIRMELLTPLQSHFANHSVTLGDVSKLAIDLCKALELCQKYNVIHRDIKPENIFVSKNGDFKLGDFGIARTIERTSSGLSKKGTYSYMAPEVYRGLEYGFTVDTYSLGLVLYRLLNQNRLPFMPAPPAPLSFSDREHALAKRISGTVLPLPFEREDGLAEIVCKACSYEPANRYSSPTSLRIAVEALGLKSDMVNLVNNNSVQQEKPPTSNNLFPETAEKTGWTASPYSAQSNSFTEKTESIHPITQPVSADAKLSFFQQHKNKLAGCALVLGLGFGGGVLLSNESETTEPSETTDITVSEFKPEEVPAPQSEPEVSTPTVSEEGEVQFSTEAREDDDSSAEEYSVTAMEGQIVNAAGGVNIRESASLDSEILSRLSNGSTVEVLLDTGNGWYKIYFNGKENGYIMADYVSLEQGLSSSEEYSATMQEGEIVTEAERVNVRKSASLDSEILTQLSNGTTVEILRDTGNGWYEVYFNGKEKGYVMDDYVYLK